MQKRNPYYDAKTFLLYVDSFDGQIPAGRFYHCVSGTGGSFRGVISLLQQLEQIMDTENLPQSFSSVRSFVPQHFWSADGGQTELQAGQAGNFVLRILFRQNASWQGVLTWTEGKQSERFRSLLELLHLLQSVLQHEQLSCEAAEGRTALGRAE